LVAASQFDVFPNPSSRGVAGRPLVVVIQANFLNDSAQRLVAPLVVEKDIKPMGRLNPAFDIDGQRLYFQPLEIAALPTKLLRRPIANLEEHRYRIVSAMDLVFLGI
jgi:toxin CcdB